MWNKDNPPNKLVMTVSENNPETKKETPNPYITPFRKETGVLVSY